MNRGFTLIELLVVVLIIGILAAIALPQYTKSVERSHTAEAIQVLGDAAAAQSIYYMQYNNFAENLSALNTAGNVTVNDASDAWNVMDIDVQNAGSQVYIELVRSAGLYRGGALGIELHQDGGMRKICVPPANKDEFCTFVQPAGYQLGGGEDPSPGGSDNCPSGSYWDGHGCVIVYI